MTRDRTPYPSKRQWVAPPNYGVRVDQPVAGFYAVKLRSGAVRMGVQIRFGPPLDPVTGEELDRGWRWMAFLDGEYIELDAVWPACTGEPITEAEYQRFCARKRWAEQEAPQSAYAQRGRKLDPFSVSEPLPF